MSPNRRIFLNIVATYGWSLYALALGLFSSRWVLVALGEVDYGLLSLVGGLIAFVTFFNNLLSISVSRFYAYSIGELDKATDKILAIEECRKWFSIALCLHTCLPILLVMAGYPLGIWAVNNFLTIPADRIVACEWVWLFVCITACVGMMSVPFSSMYNAKQEIAELTVYSFITTTINIVFVYYIASHPGDWLKYYAGWTMLLSVVPAIIIDVRALIKYPECRFRLNSLRDGDAWGKLLGFSGLRFFGAISQLVTSQGMAITVNKLLGPAKNAAMAVGNNLTFKTMILNGSFNGAFMPAITNAAGQKDGPKMRMLINTSCVLCGFGLLIFAVPVMLEADELMILWLKTPPGGAALLCKVWLLAMFVDQITIGLYMGLFAVAKILEFQIMEGCIWISSLFIAGAWMLMGGDVVGVGVGYAIMYCMNNCVKLYYARKYCGISVRHWFMRVGIPLPLVGGIAFAVAYLPQLFMAPSFMRIVVTTCLAEMVFLPLMWFFVLKDRERDFIVSRVKAVCARIKPSVV